MAIDSRIRSRLRTRSSKPFLRPALLTLALYAAAFALSHFLEKDGRSGGPSENGRDRRENTMRQGTGQHEQRPPSMAAPSLSISGDVRTLHGGAIAGATVCVSAAAECCKADRCTLTDALGNFAFADVPRTVRGLSASAVGHLSQVEPIDIPSDSSSARASLRLKPGGVEVSGSVIDITGGPVAGATVTARTAATEGWAHTSADSAGQFRLSVPEGATTITAQAEAYAAARTEVLAPALRLVLALVPASALAGRVLTDTQSALAGASVRMARLDDIRAEPETLRSTTEGAFRFDGLAPGRYELEATAPHWRSVKQAVAIGVAETKEDLVITAHPATPLTATVDVAGTPCPSPHLDLEGPIHIFARAHSEGGKIHVDGLPPGYYRLTVGCAGRPHEPATEELHVGITPIDRAWNLEVGADGTAPAADACCEPSASIRVEVGPADAPLPAPMVLVKSKRWAGMAPAIRGVQRGTTFMFEKLELGPYDVFLEQAPEARQQVLLERDGQLAEVRVDPPERTEILGYVRDHGDLPIADVWVRARNARTGDESSDFIMSALTDAEGAFALSGLFAGRYELHAEAATGRARLDNVQGGSRDVVLRVHPHGSIAGNVTSASGRPEAFLLVYRQRGDSQIQTRGGVGAWALGWLPSGTYELLASSTSGFAQREVTLEPGAELDVALVIDASHQSHVPDWARNYLIGGNLEQANNNKGEHDEE